jgi:hypothetical protein
VGILYGYIPGHTEKSGPRPADHQDGRGKIPKENMLNSRRDCEATAAELYWVLGENDRYD